MCSVSHNIYRHGAASADFCGYDQRIKKPLPVLAAKVALFKVANFEKKISLVACTYGMTVLWHNPSLSHGNARNGV